MLPTSSNQIKTFIEYYNKIRHIQKFFEQELVQEHNTILFHKLSVSNHKLIYQIFCQEFDNDDEELYYENKEAFYQKLANYPCEKVKECAFSSVQEFILHLSGGHLSGRARSEANHKICKEYEIQHPDTDWCLVSVCSFDAYPIPRHEFATKPKHHERLSRITYRGFRYYFKSNTLARLIEWQNKFILERNKIYKNFWHDINEDIAKNNLNDLLELYEKPFTIHQDNLLNIDTEIKKIRQHLIDNRIILIPMLERISLRLLMGILAIMGIVQYILHVKFHYLAWAIVVWLLILFNGVRIILWLEKDKAVYKHLQDLRKSNPNIPLLTPWKNFWLSGYNSQKWAFAVLVTFSLYILFVLLPLPKILTQIMFYIMLSMAVLWGIFLYKDNNS